MSNLLQERWLRLSGLLVEGDEGGSQEENPHAWYQGAASGDTQGTTVVSEIGFCISVMDGGGLPTEAELLEAANGDCFGAVDSTKANILKYAPAMKLHQKGGMDELSYQLKTAQQLAKKAIEYIKNVYQDEVSGDEGTITGVKHLGVSASKGEGSNTGDVEVSFNDGSGTAGTQKISLKSYEQIDAKTTVTKQAVSVTQRFGEYYGTDHPMLSSYLRELKEKDSGYKPVSAFRIVSDWSYMKAGVAIKDLMVGDISDPSSGYSQARDTALSGKKDVRSFNWTTDSATTTDTRSQVEFTAEEIAAMTDDADEQRRDFAGQRVPSSSQFNRGSGITPKEFQKGGSKRTSTELGEDEDSDYAKFNNEMRPILQDAMAELCNGAWSKSYVMSLIRRSLGVIVIAGNPTVALVVVTSDSLQTAIDEAIQAPAEQFTFEPDGKGIAIKVAGKQIAKGNFDLGGAAGWTIAIKASLKERYSLAKQLLGHPTKQYNRWTVKISAGLIG